MPAKTEPCNQVFLRITAVLLYLLFPVQYTPFALGQGIFYSKIIITGILCSRSDQPIVLILVIPLGVSNLAN